MREQGGNESMSEQFTEVTPKCHLQFIENSFFSRYTTPYRSVGSIRYFVILPLFYRFYCPCHHYCFILFFAINLEMTPHNDLNVNTIISLTNSLCFDVIYHSLSAQSKLYIHIQAAWAYFILFIFYKSGTSRSVTFTIIKRQ